MVDRKEDPHWEEGQRISGGVKDRTNTIAGWVLAAGIAALQMLDETRPYGALNRAGGRIRDAVLGAAEAKDLPVQVPQFGAMFSIFFNAAPVTDLATATASDAALYGRFFHACLRRGVYLAPSAYEAAFLSTAHAPEIVDRACEILSASLAEL